MKINSKILKLIEEELQTLLNEQGETQGDQVPASFPESPPASSFYDMESLLNLPKLKKPSKKPPAKAAAADNQSDDSFNFQPFSADEYKKIKIAISNYANHRGWDVLAQTLEQYKINKSKLKPKELEKVRKIQNGYLENLDPMQAEDLPGEIGQVFSSNIKTFLSNKVKNASYGRSERIPYVQKVQELFTNENFKMAFNTREKYFFEVATRQLGGAGNFFSMLIEKPKFLQGSKLGSFAIYYFKFIKLDFNPPIQASFADRSPVDDQSDNNDEPKKVEKTDTKSSTIVKNVKAKVSTRTSRSFENADPGVIKRIYKIQQVLQQKGFLANDPDELDGIFGVRTSAAIRKSLTSG